MTRYLLRVYRGGAFYPDRSSDSLCRRRLARRARRFERDGFRVTLIALPSERGLRRRPSHPATPLRDPAGRGDIQAWGRSGG
jgi:hypothetical protein